MQKGRVMASVRCGAILCLALASIAQAAEPSPPAVKVLGPGEFPDHLKGTWKVSLCCRPYHAWIRFENAKTGEVHTAARFRHGSGDAPDPIDGTALPSVDSDGVWWDQDLRHEASIRCGFCLLATVILDNPAVYRGCDAGEGYCVVWNNCTHYAAEAWHFYSGECYPVGCVGLPKKLAADVARHHPGLSIPYHLG